MQFGSVSASAGDPKKSNYQLDFYVRASGISSSGDVFCWMRIQNGSTVYVVHRDSGQIGKCYALTPQQHYRGKFRHGAIELLWYEGAKPKTQSYLIDEQILGQ
jgi:hypothetical protein